MVVFKLLDKNNIDQIWPTLSSMLVEVLKHTHGEETEWSVRKAVLDNNISVVLLYENNMIEGFFTVNPCKDILYIPHTYINKRKPKEYLILMNNKIEEIGKEFGCKVIQAYSDRKGMMRRLKPLGWKQGYVEYIKEI
jgi:hypothetical protein